MRLNIKIIPNAKQNKLRPDHSRPEEQGKVGRNYQMTNFMGKYKLIFPVVLFLTLLSLPSLARPFAYSLNLGPNYWLTNGRKAGIESNLLTCGFSCSARLPGKIEAEYSGGYGVISNSQTSFNEISFLYNLIDRNNLFFGYGILYTNYNYTLDKEPGS